MPGTQAWAAPGSALPDDGRSAVSAPPLTSKDAKGSGASAQDQTQVLGGDIAFRPLGISEMLDGAITCIRRNPKAVLGLSVAICGVIQVLNSLAAYFFIGGVRCGGQNCDELTPSPVMRSVGTQFTLGFVGLVMSAYGTLLLAGLLSPVISRILFGESTSLRQSWRDTRPVLLRLIGTAAAVMTLSLLGLVIPLVPFVLLLIADAPAALGVLSGVLGFPLGLALMVWVYVLWVLAVPAVVLERQTVGGALRRAYQLSRKRWWRTCGTLLLALLITIFMGFLALRIPFVFVQFLIFGEDPSGGDLVGSLAVDTLGRIVSWSLITPFDAGVIALLYVDRRMRREGFDLDVQSRSRDKDGDGPGDPLDVWRPVNYPPAPEAPPMPPRPPYQPPYGQRPPYPQQPYGPAPYPQQPHPQQPYPQQPYPQGPYPQQQPYPGQASR